MLVIFSQLDTESLRSVESVCNRWNYLANTPELWMYKCRVLGRTENLGEIENLLINELQKDEEIDWRLAFLELEAFVQQLKLNYIPKFDKENEGSNLIILYVLWF